MKKTVLAAAMLSSSVWANGVTPPGTAAPARITQLEKLHIQVELQAPKQIPTPFEKAAAALAGCIVEGQLYHSEIKRDFAKFDKLRCRGKLRDVVAYAVDEDGQTGFRPELTVGSPLTVVFVHRVKPEQ